MKKLILLASLACFAVTATSTVATAQASSTVKIGTWQASTTQTFKGNDNKWYKLNATDKTVSFSSDGTTWEITKSGMWQDKDGKWMKVMDAKLKWSADQGGTWTEVPEWTWVGGDGKSYKFDATWKLMVKKIK